MSILLDALKRSETQRDLGRTPTLQTSTDSAAPALTMEPAWVPGVMALLAAVLIGWMGLQQFYLPDDWEASRMAARQAQSGPAGAESGLTSEPQQDRSGESVAGRSILPKLPESPTASATASSESSAGQRGLSREVRDYAAEEPVSEPSISARSRSAATQRDDAVRQSQLPRVEVAQDALPRQGRDSEGDTRPRTAAAEPYEPEIINYWQVPEKMREGLPDLRISVLVYAEQPDNRFLLLNGERMKEGQELPNGLLLEEIRRDRAIFNYRNYRFFLKS